MAELFDMIAKTFFGLESVLAEELTGLGAHDVQLGRRMVSFVGDTPLLVRANLSCRTAVRILKPIAMFAAADEGALYQGIGQIDWSEYLDADNSLAIDPVVHGGVFANSLYAAQLAKDAIVDQFRERVGRRPSVDLANPDLRLNLHIAKDRVTVYLDSSGDSLHKRGYRAATGEAPINEVLAAGILRLSGWDAKTPLSDFMCGSGTFLIEAALLARRIAPGLVRKHFGYLRWRGFDRAVHESIVAELRNDVLTGLDFPLQGSDLDAQVIEAARDNARRAGVSHDISWLVQNFETAAPPSGAGTLVTNPPYDIRMKTSQLEAVYRRIGEVLKRNWSGHSAYVFTGNLEAAKHIGLRAASKTRLFNGPIECRLLKFQVNPSPASEPLAHAFDQSSGSALKTPQERGQDQDAFLRNRLSRMARHWHRWARRQGITCYRLYDRDIPEIPLDIDWYQGHVVITEHERPHSRTEIEHRAWLAHIVQLIADTLEVASEDITLRTKTRLPAASRPQSKGKSPLVAVRENDLTFQIRLADARETGFEIDQRILRGLLREQSAGKRFLNLFGRTGTATVAVAAGGATESVTVEASEGMLEWARENLESNHLSGPMHQLVCQDPLEFVAQRRPADGPLFDLALVQPGGFDGKRRDGVWNVQDGHAALVNRLLECMPPGGRLYFLTSFRRLALHEEQILGASVREITRHTVPAEFRNKKVHRAWLFTRT